MGSPTVDVVTRRVLTGTPGQSDGMPGDGDRRIAAKFCVALNSLRKAETQTAQNHADCE